MKWFQSIHLLERMVCGFLNPMGEGISAGMESGYCAASAIMEHFDNPSIACEAYRQSTENLKSYMQRQWSLVGGMAGTFRDMGIFCSGKL